MQFTKPITNIIKARFSCRTYAASPIEMKDRQKLNAFMATSQSGPLGAKARFELIAATEDDASALKGLGTYGFIKNPTGFIAGAVSKDLKDMEDFGYLLECIVLYATNIGLGTCWLGGTFTKSRFAKKIALRSGETMPAVIATGYPAGVPRPVDVAIRQGAGSDNRLPWERLFFENTFDAPLARESTGDYAVPLEMLRLAPSASNKQPWRVVKGKDRWHFYLQRTPGYGKRILGLVKLDDLQRVDIGIAMSHFALTAEELGLRGQWDINEPDIEKPGILTHYIVSWVSQ